ncbi:MAG: hypothetical protein ACI89X_003155 [Planctomycetota bacterium]|jgi:hypothetical protein
MSMRITAGLLLALVAGCGTPSAPRQAKPVDAPARSLALLVGINEYVQPERGRVPMLSGAANDVRLAGKMLVERFDFEPENVLILTDEQATHAGIIQAFYEHILQRAQADTRVVFWFSGHGSRVIDLSGVETSKTKDIGDGAYDNSMLAHDSRAKELDGSYDISDDELHSLMRALTQITDQVLVVTDCCHSGGAMRGESPVPGIRATTSGGRGVNRSTLQTLWPSDVPFFEDGEATELESFPYVHIAACDDYQEAGEVEIGREVYGTMTWFLVEAMEKVKYGDSWRSVIERVRARVAGVGNRPNQIVNGSGEIDRLVFETDAAPPLPGFRADRSEDRLRIGAGRAHGMTDGAVFKIVSLRDGEQRGLVRATQVSGSSCIAEWTEGGESEYADDVLRAVPEPAALGMAPLLVFIDGDLDVTALSDSPWIILCDDAAKAEFRLKQTGQGAVLCDLQGRRLRPVPLNEVGLREAMFREYTFRGMWESVVQPSEWTVELSVGEPDDKTREVSARHGIPLATALPAKAGAKAVRVQAEPMSPTAGGSLLTLYAKNNTDVDLRLTVLSLSEDRSVNIVWPPRNEFDRVLRARDAQPVTVVVGPSTEWRQSRPMVDRYVAILTKEPADFTAFTSSAPVWSATRGGPPVVPSFLQSLLATAPTRGAQDPTDTGFGLAWCDLHLSPPPEANAAEVGR